MTQATDRDMLYASHRVISDAKLLSPRAKSSSGVYNYIWRQCLNDCLPSPPIFQIRIVGFINNYLTLEIASHRIHVCTRAS